LDGWLANVFNPERVEQSLAILEAATQPDVEPEREELQRALAGCDRKLARHRAALEAGADPALVVTWSREVQREQEALRARLAASRDRSVHAHRMSGKEIRVLVDQLGGLLSILREADPTDKLEVYRQLGVKLTYSHEKRVVIAETQPEPPVCVVNVSEGGLQHTNTRLLAIDAISCR
jgi:hypothetical protein